MEKLGRYELLRPIASGGMAKVYLGRTNSVGGFERLVAIKLMHPHLADDNDFVSMFLDEARLAAQIRHPHVVGVSDVDRSDEGMFLVMDFVDGAPLSRIISRQRAQGEALPLGVLLRIFLDAMAGLHAAHELQQDGQPMLLVHRDISPANILVGLDGLARITDFGVARAEARIATTRGGEVKGKMPYMSPEHIMGEDIDRRADVYSSACVLWEMLTLKRLFKADKGVIGAVLKGPQLTAAQASPFDVPSPIDDVVMQGLLPQDQRPESAEAFADLLLKASTESGVAVADHRTVAQHLTQLGIESAEHSLPRRSRPSAAPASLGTTRPERGPNPSPFEDTQRASQGVRTETTLATSTADELSQREQPSRARQWLALAAAVGIGGILAALGSGRIADDNAPKPSATTMPASAVPLSADAVKSASAASPSAATTASSSAAAATAVAAPQSGTKRRATRPTRRKKTVAAKTGAPKAQATAAKPAPRSGKNNTSTTKKAPPPRTSDQFRPDAP